MISLQSAVGKAQLAISEILLAEAEKIKSVTQNNGDFCQILEVNSSVSVTIEQLMWLEFMSYQKIKAMCGVCGESFPEEKWENETFFVSPDCKKEKITKSPPEKSQRGAQKKKDTPCKGLNEEKFVSDRDGNRVYFSTD